MAQWESDWLEVAGPSLTRCNMFCPWARQLILCLVLVLPRNRPDMTEKLLTRRKFQLKKIKKALHQKKNLKIKKISKWNYASVRENKFQNDLSKRSPSEKEILQNLTLNSRLCFIESVHENYQWKAHQPSKAPSMGVILVKKPLLFWWENQTIIFTKIIEKKCLRSLWPKCLYTYEKFDAIFCCRSDSVVLFNWDRKSIHNCSTIWEKCTKLIRQLVPCMNTRMQEELTGSIT